MFEKMKVYAFVGPSGTGKSYRAQMVASEKGINFIIDDGLLIKDNQVIAGVSAKKAPTKIETVKHALFYNEEEKKPIKEAFKNNPLIIGGKTIANIYGNSIFSKVQSSLIKVTKERSSAITGNIAVYIDAILNGLLDSSWETQIQ